MFGSARSFDSRKLDILRMLDHMNIPCHSMCALGVNRVARLTGPASVDTGHDLGNTESASLPKDDLGIGEISAWASCADMCVQSAVLSGPIDSECC